jgi:hypothetical protein
VKLIDHIKQFLFGHAPPPAHMVEYMAAAGRVEAAARRAGVEDTGPFGSMADEMKNGVRPPKSRKRSKRAT